MKVVTRVVLALVLLAVVALVIARSYYRPDRIAAGLVAHHVCNALYVAGRDPDATFRELVAPIIGEPAIRLFDYRVDATAKSVHATALGFDRARADFMPGYGCRLAFDDNDPAPPPRAAATPPPADDFAPDAVVQTGDPALAAAIDRVFVENPQEKTKDVKAVVIVRDGHVIAERYARGYGIDTPLLSYSVAKSFTNALVGLLVRDGKLDVTKPLGAPEWQRPDDPRARITIEDLMRMRSGLDVTEAESAFSPVARMEFLHADMAGFAAQGGLQAPVGAVFDYTSANTLLVDRLVGRTIGGGPAGLVDFAQRELFAPLHMRDVTMEIDGRGTFVGASHLWAPARSFARFAELYLDDGVTRDGHRLLPEGWVAWSKRSTLGTGYGAGFFTNEGSDRFTAYRIRSGFPKDGFFASGNLGQRLYIVPSAHLVVARFGYSRPPDFGIDDDLALIKAAIDATR